MPLLPSPPPLPERAHGWLAQTLPVVASLASVGVLTAASGHLLVALVMIGATLLGSGLQLDHQLSSRRRLVATRRTSYADLLAGLAPSPDWEPPSEADADPVCRVLAVRHAARLRALSSRPVVPRDPTPHWGSGTLRAELAEGMWLDLREAALGGVGPHGVIVGATGSGKSELLRALVLSLALQLSPDDVTFLLVDFKGGTGLGDLAALPHCAGLVTNLADSPRLVPRMVRALDAELDRRQRLVRGGDATVPLVLVIDEFSELLTAHPSVLEVLVRVGRLGRSLGVHLVLASQRLDETRLRELDAHLSWRLALRTFTDTESRAVLGIPDAAALPREPGWALLRTGPETPVRLRVAAADDGFCAQAIGQVAGSAEPVAPIWLAPLEESPHLTDLLAQETPDSTAGEPGVVVVGMTDDPVARRIVTLPSRGGHVAVVGCPGSGKSSLLATIATGLEAAGAGPILELDPRAPQLPAMLVPGTVLLVDDWSVLRQEHPLVEDALVRAALSVSGLSIVLAAHRWADVRPALRDLLETRIELRLADPLDSAFDRRTAAEVPKRPGWGLFDGEHFVAATVSTSP